MGEVFWVALKLGLTAFGGPIAHLGYFERTYVKKLEWLTSAEYAQLVALCQSLPGPTSSQVGFLVGMRRAGWRGALAAWTGFTLPSALSMYACAIVAAAMSQRSELRWFGPILHGLVLTAVAVVAQAVWSMARDLCPDWTRRSLAALACLALLSFASPATQVVVMLLGALAGRILCRGVPLPGIGGGLSSTVRPRMAAGAIASYVLLLGGFAGFTFIAPHGPGALAAIFYRAGALVFGGGHVVLPLLRQELVPGGWLSDRDFLSGYALAQGVPGPLFSVAAYLGAASAPPHQAAAWSLLAVVAIFLPGLLLAAGGVSLWNAAAKVAGAGAALAGINAAVVGILAAALYDPVWRNGVTDVTDAVVAAVALALLQLVRLPAAVIAVGCVVACLCRQLLSL
jgi:chromate transporter